MNKPVSNSVLQDIIKKNKGKFKYELIDWIQVKKLSWKALSCNPNAIELLEAKIKIEKSLKKAAYEKLTDDKKIDWVALSSNPAAIKLLKENPDDIDWDALSSNPNAIDMLKGNIKDIDWNELSGNNNPKAIELLTDNFNDINWEILSSNPNAIELLKKHPKNINWKALSSNPNAIELLTNNPAKIDWEELSSNPNAIELLKANPDKIVWHYLSTNPNAMNIFTANPGKIDWWFLSRNPNPLFIKLLKAHKNDIDWKEFSKNPSIFIENKGANTVKSPAKPMVKSPAKPMVKSPTPIVKSPAKPMVKSPKKCPDNKVLNPKTGRCILIKNTKATVNKPTKATVNKPTKSPTPIVKSPKKCPDNKVLNPKTGRCISIKNTKATENKPTKSPKKCPDNKVLNPKTGRCILIPPLKPYNKKGGRICSRILTPKQVGETCWFMAIFVAMFYSQRSRKILLEASRNWDIKKDLFKKIKDILHDKYLKTGKGNDYNDYNGDIFIEIISLLYEENQLVFPYNPKKFSYGFYAEVYIGRLYKLLNVDYKMFDYQTVYNRVAYSAFNEDLDIFRYSVFRKDLKRRVDTPVEKGYKYVEDKKAPPILIIRLYDYDGFDMYSKGHMLESHVLPDGEAKDELKSTREKITYNEQMYKLDSTILMSFNGRDYGESHYITGITCKNKKYLYNGWLRTQIDPTTVDENKTIKIPCELMRYDWDVDNKYFCIDTTNCSPKILDYHTELKRTMPIDFCFNFKYGQRLLIYVREDAKSDTSNESSSPTSKESSSVPDVSLLNIKTGGRRPILTKNSKVAANKPL